MVRQRICRIWPSVSLALLLSLLNTLILLVYLGPINFRNQSVEGPYEMVPGTQEKNQRDVQPYSSTDRVSKIKSAETKLKKLVSVVMQPSNKHGVLVQLPQTEQNDPSVVEFNKWLHKMPVAKYDNLDHAHKQLTFNQNAMLMVGKPPKNPVEIVIGIPTVTRTSSDYLSSTLRQLVNHLGPNETKECHIVVFSADFDVAGNEKTANFVSTKFKKEVDSGLIEVLRPDMGFYPKLADLPVLWKDTPDRIKWRSKQCVDYALMFAYCRNLGKYYLQLEDDVSVAKNYFTHIKAFVQARDPSRWSNLQFGTGGFIGMLFRSSDLGRLALFVKMYYWIFPVDILFRHFNDIHLYGNGVEDVYNPPLFRHVGAESSLKGQTRQLEASQGQNVKYINQRLYKDANNPPCFISTNIETFGSNTIDGPYRTEGLGFFWGRGLKVSDFVLIQFTKDLTLLRVAIDTGSQFAPKDTIGDGQLVATGALAGGECDKKNYSLLKSRRTENRIEASADKVGGITGVRCVRLTITKLNKDLKGTPTWLVIREIAVWTQ